MESVATAGPLDATPPAVVSRRNQPDRATHRFDQPAPASLGRVLSGGAPSLRGLDAALLLGLHHPVSHPGKTGHGRPAALGKIPAHPKAVAAGNGSQTAGN